MAAAVSLVALLAVRFSAPRRGVCGLARPRVDSRVCVQQAIKTQKKTNQGDVQWRIVLGCSDDSIN